MKNSLKTFATYLTLQKNIIKTVSLFIITPTAALSQVKLYAT